MPLLPEVFNGNNSVLRFRVQVGVVPNIVMPENHRRVAYRIYADPDNEDNVFHGYDNGLDTLNTFNIVGPGELFEDNDKEEVYKGDVYLISGTAAQTCIIEEVFLK